VQYYSVTLSETFFFHTSTTVSNSANKCMHYINPSAKHSRPHISAAINAAGITGGGKRCAQSVGWKT
jgi:hypothetical protein